MESSFCPSFSTSIILSEIKHPEMFLDQNTLLENQKTDAPVDPANP